jgi:uncharacterized protein
MDKNRQGWESLTIKYKDLILKIEEQFKIDFYGLHGIEHWKRVYENTQKLASYYKIQSEVFGLFSLLHDSKRVNEDIDKFHGKRASLFVEELIKSKEIILDDEDTKRLIYACKNHTHSDKKDPLYKDLVVQICFDSDRLDIDRVCLEVDSKYLATDYAKKLANNN